MNKRTAFFVLVVATLTCRSGASGLFTIDGVLVDGQSNTPIASAFVSVQLVNEVGERDSPPSSLTNANGSFHFANLPAGKYTLLAQRRGSRQYLFHGHGQFSTAIVTGPNLDTQHILFALPAPSRISGAVVDEDNEAVPDATVTLLKKVVMDGRSTVQQVDLQNTGASGRFHFGPLRPGVFYLAVVARPWYASHDDATRFANADAPQGTFRDVAYPVTYSGDTTDASSASPIPVDAGAESKLTVTLRPARALHIPLNNGVMANGADYPTGTQMIQSLSVLGPGGVPIAVGLETQQSFVNGLSTGPLPGNMQTNMELAGVAPGTYRIVSRTDEADQSVKMGNQEVVLTENAPISRATKTLVQVGGRLLIDDHLEAGSDNMIVIAFIDRHTHAAHAAFSVPNGQFAVNDGLPSGSYELLLMNRPDLAIQSISEGTSPKVQGDVLNIPSQASALNNLVLHASKAGVTSLEGIVTSNGKPLMAATVLLLPGSLEGAKPIGRDQSDSDGSFTIPNVTAGQYRLLAIEEPANGAAEDLRYRDKQAVAPYWTKAIPITVQANSKTRTLQVEAQPRVQSAPQ